MDVKKTAELLSIADVATEMDVQPVTVRRWIMLGYLAAAKLGNINVITRESLDKFKKLDRRPGNPNFRKD